MSTNRARDSQTRAPARLPYASAEYVALVEHERLLGIICRLAGFEDVERAPTYDDLVAAAADGPLVYLAAVAHRGFAVVVPSGGEDPVGVELPALTRAAVQAHGASLRTASYAYEIADVMRALLPRLWDDAFAPLAEHLRPDGLVTLVATGGLGELPLHAAVCCPGADGVWVDRVPGLVVRYTPNARVLRSALEVADGLAGTDMRVLTVACADAPGERRLPHASQESELVGRIFGHDACCRPVPATVARVSAALSTCTIWHFACHGRHDREVPLRSSLALHDGPLTLAMIMAQPGGRQRLSVLSACQTSAVGNRAPDEVVGFPSAMLRAGVAGVAACLHDIQDDAAMLLVLRFCTLIVRELAPVQALTQAQAWLRSATNRELHEAFPEAHEYDNDAGAEWADDRPFAEPVTWALFSYTGA